MKPDEKAAESIVFGIAIALLVLIVSWSVIRGGGRELSPYGHGRVSLARNPDRTNAILPLIDTR